MRPAELVALAFGWIAFLGVCFGFLEVAAFFAIAAIATLFLAPKPSPWTNRRDARRRNRRR